MQSIVALDRALRHQEVVVDLPLDERKTWLADLNEDGKQDPSCIALQRTMLPTSHIG